MAVEELKSVLVDTAQIFIVDPATLSTWEPGDWDPDVTPANSYARVTAFGFDHDGYGAVEGGVLVLVPSDGLYSVLLHRNSKGRFIKAVIDLGLKAVSPFTPIATVTTTVAELLIIDPGAIDSRLATEVLPPPLGGIRIPVDGPGTYKVSIQRSEYEFAAIQIAPHITPVKKD
jgi:hypothetical protein